MSVKTSNKRVRRDNIAAPFLAPSGNWRYRVFDSMEGKYKSLSFVRDEQGEDKGRTKPGTVAGDRWAEAEVSKLRLGLSTTRATTLTLLGAAYVASREAAGRSASQIGIIKNILSRAIDAGLDDLTDERLPERCQHWLSKLKAARPGQKRAKPASPRLKNKALVVLRSIGSYGVKRGALIRNPFLAVERYEEIRRIRRVFNLDELRAIVSHEHEGNDLWMMAVLAVYTGQRSETLRSLTWSMIDWQANRIRIPGDVVKQAADVRCPLQPELREILGEHAGVGNAPILGAYLSGITSDRANELFQRYQRSIGIVPEGRSLHACRHSVASLLTATGQSQFLVMDALGHFSTQTSKHYASGADEYHQQVRAEKWEEGCFYLRRTPPALLKKSAGEAH